ncbi:MAG TPA: HEAT repeat domain-containing protein [Planctomycetota bacterium]|nr:HEAT repeat domain-containing protein [Planctomycetota bacterium]
MLTLRARAAFGVVAALVAAGCVEVEVRRTLAPDHSGRQTLTLRAPRTARTDAFPGLFSGATCQPPTTQAAGDAVVHTAEVTFPDVTRFHHQAGFLSSLATVATAADGAVTYRETLTNSYTRNLGRAPSEEARKSLAAAMEEAKKSLDGAKLTYTIQFPGTVAKSNADRVSGSEATWVLTTDKVFAGRAVELTADYRTGPPPAVAVAAPPAGVVPLAAPVAPKPPELLAPLVPVAPVAAPAPKPVVAAAAPAPKPTETPVTRPSSRLEDVLLAQADEPARKEDAAGDAPAAEPAPKEPPKKAPPKVAPPKRPPGKEEPPVTTLPPELIKKTPQDLTEAAGDDATTAEVKKLFRDALVHLDYKRYGKAAEALQKAITLKPDSVLISNLYERVVAKFLDAAIESNNPEMKAQAEALQQLAYKGRIRQLRDPKRVVELVEALRKGFLPRTFAIEELTLAGDYAVPHLLKFMIDHTDAELRAYAGHVLSRMRGTAVPAICEALKHNDPMIRQILLLAIEVIADPRSVPTLLWLAQEPDGHPLVVAAARRALARIAPDPATLQTPAASAFLDLAKDYYDGNRKVLPAHVYEHLVWRYDPDRKELTSEIVPQHLYAPRMAEETCRNALLADPDYEPAVPLLLCACFAQQNLIESFYTVIAGKEPLSKEEQEEAELAKPLRERLGMAPAIAQAAGQKFAYAALQRALRDGRADVALSCIYALKEVASPASLPGPAPSEEELKKAEAEKAKKAPARRRRIMIWYGPEEKEEPPPPPPVVKPNSIQLDGSPLIDALSYPDRRVRYAAAEAVVAIAPMHVIRDASKVMSNLAQALSETAYHVALLFEEDEGRAEELRPLLREAGVLPVLVRAQTDALSAARESPPKDILILSGELKRVDVAEAVANLRRVYTVAAAPLIVVAPKADEAKLRERLSKENAIYVPRPLTAGAVRAAVEEALKSTPAPKNQEASVRYAASAARTLASIHPAASIFRLDDALDALFETLSATTQPDAVRLPCCEAIRHAASPRAIPYLAQTYRDPRASKDLRLAILRALGACAGAQPNLPEEAARQTTETLTLGVTDADPDFRRAAAHAFGLKGGASGSMVELVDCLYGKAPQQKPAEKPKEGPPADKAPVTIPAEKAKEE